jgi:hypothetical protein
MGGLAPTPVGREAVGAVLSALLVECVLLRLAPLAALGYGLGSMTRSSRRSLSTPANADRPARRPGPRVNAVAGPGESWACRRDTGPLAESAERGVPP